jgi:hypothetical protein
MKLFHRIPTPLLSLAALASVVLMGLDLILPDPLPLIDEVFLLFLTAGSTSELMARFRSQRLLPPEAGDQIRLSLREERDAKELLASLASRANSLIARSRVLEEQGHPARLFRPLQTLADQVAERLLFLADHAAQQARRQNDPWQIRRKIEKLEKRIFRVQVGRPTKKLDRLREELVGLKQHEIATYVGIRAAGERKQALLALSVQVDALAEDLTRISAEGLTLAAGGTLTLKVSELGPLEPTIEEVTRALGEFALAEAEVDGAVVPTASVRTPPVVGTRSSS